MALDSEKLCSPLTRITLRIVGNKLALQVRESIELHFRKLFFLLLYYVNIYYLQ